MECQLVKTHFVDYAEGKVPADLMDAIGRHLETCTDCQSYFRIVKDFNRFIESEKAMTVSPFLVTRMEEQLTHSPRKLSPTFSFRLVNTFYYYAAVVVVALGIGVFTGKQLGSMMNTKDTNVVVTSESEQLKQDFYLNEIEKDDVSQVLNNQ